jgi:membrane glycosyltransferase
LPYAAIMLAGLLLSVPLAVMTSWPSFGRLLMRWQLLSLPEELSPPLALQPLDLEVLRFRAAFKAKGAHE